MARADIKLTTDMDSSKLQAGLARARAGIRSFASSAMGQFAMLAGVAGFGGLAQKAIEFGSIQSDIAGQLNINTTAFQTLAGAMRDAGGSQSQMQKSIANMSKAIIQGGEGITTYKRAFDRLGLSMDDLKGKSTSEQFNMIAKAVAGAENQQEAFTSVMEVFGTRNAPQLIEVMKRVNSEGFEAMSEKIKETYGIMDEETQQKLDAVADKIEQFKIKTTVIFGDLLVKVMPYVEMLGLGLKHLGTAFAGLFEVVKTYLTATARVAQTILDPMIKQFKGFGQVIASFKDIGNPKKMFEGMKKGAESYLEGVKEVLDFRDTFSAMKDGVKDVSEVFGEQFNIIAESGQNTVDEIMKKYQNMGKEVAKTTNEVEELNDAIGTSTPDASTGTGGTTGSGGSGKGGKVSSTKDRFDEMDLNKSGAVTAREKREFARQQKKIEKANDKLRRAEKTLDREFGGLEGAMEQEAQSKFGDTSLQDPSTRGGRRAKAFKEAQDEVARLDPDSPLADGESGALDKSKKGGGADEAEKGKKDDMIQVLEEIKGFNETTDENITKVRELLDKIDGALT